MAHFLNRWLWAALLLVATAVTWNHRFTPAPHPLNQLTFENPLLQQSPLPAKNRPLFIEENGETILRLQRPTVDDRPHAFSVRLDHLEDLRFIHISCDYRWEDVTLGRHDWEFARCVIMDRNAAGEWIYPTDFSLFQGTGNQDWTQFNVVRELTDLSRESQISFQMLGATGTLEAKNFRVFKLTQRPWFPPVIALLCLAWTTWFFLLFKKIGVTGWLRPTLASLLLLASAWAGVFPQTSTLLMPVLGSFNLTLPALTPPPPSPSPVATQTPSPPPKTTTPPKITPPAPDPTPAPAPDPSPTVTTPSPTPPPPESRSSGFFNQHLRALVHRFKAVHLLIFAGLTLLFLSITAQRKSWLIVAGLATLSETIPPLVRYGYNLWDIVDLSLNLAGIALGLLLWNLLLPLFRKIRLIPQGPTS
ncbi:MAG: hypothetical protein ACSHYF_16890 [Verrucomicrobiaceae bacterium]